MGCQACGQKEPEAKLNEYDFDSNKENNSGPINGQIKPIKNSEDHNNFLKEFEKKLELIGNYTSLGESDEFLTEEQRKYISENALDFQKYINPDNTSFEVKPIEFQNGNIYHGGWNENFQMEGYGKYYLKDERVLAEGVWEKGELKFARVFLPNGDIYEGEINKSVFNGKGKLISSTGEVYEGDFVDGEKTGNGKIIFPDGTEYNGEIEKGAINGQGTMKWANQIEYKGNFSYFMLYGYGHLTNSQGDKYEGNFEGNYFHGDGKYTYSNGDNYNGNFDFGVRKGRGVFTQVNGFCYEGDWDNNLPNGFGQISDNNCKFKCTWRNGKMVEEPIFERGSSNDLENINLKFRTDEMILSAKNLPYLVKNEDVDTSQYKPGTLPSFLED